MGLNAIVMTLLLLAALGTFAVLMTPRMRLLLAVQPTNRFDDVPERVKSVLKFAIGQWRMPRELIAGVAHIFIFAGFMVVSLATVQHIVHAYVPGWHLLPSPLNEVYTLVKDLLEVQRYPEGPRPYDVAGWTLPHLLGVRRVTVMEELEGDFDRAESVEVAVAGFAGDERAAHVSERGGSTRHSDSWRDIFDALENDDFVSFAIAGDRAGLYDIGNNSTNSDQERIRVDRLPRIGLYAPWSGSMDEGWMRWVFDTWDVPYTRVRNEQVRAGELGDFLDVLIIPDIRGRQLDEGRTEGTVPNEYASGLAPEGAVAIEEFVRSGGRLITFDASSEWAIELFQLPLVDVTREESGRDFSCPGSVLRAIPQAGQTWTAGLPGSLGLFFSRSTAWRPMNEAERKESGRDEKNMTTLLRYAPTRVLLSGWIREPQVIAGHDAWVRAHHGHGDVHLFAFRPQYRGWTQSTFPLVFRAILFEDPPAEN